MTKVAVVLLLSMLAVGGNIADARSFDYQAYELFNLLEYLYPEILSPRSQVTRLDRDGAFYRRYSTTGFGIKTKDDRLYVIDDQGGSYDWGSIDGFWMPFVQSELIFNWLETQLPGIFPPKQSTQGGNGIFFRFYPETGAMIGTFDDDLYCVDGEGRLSHLGTVEFWLDAVGHFEEPLAGVYTIRQKSTNRYVDAFETETILHDYNLVTRGQQDDDTQKWVITPLGEDSYTIQQKSTMRYVDAFESETGAHDYELVTRGKQEDDTQKWIIRPLGDGVFTMQQKSTMRYVDAFETDTVLHDYDLVTRRAQNDNSQKWIFTMIPEDMEFLGIEYDLEDAEIISETDARVIATELLKNNSPTEQEMVFALNETIQEESYFEQTVGFQVEVGRQLSVGIPYLEASASISISAGYEWTSGHSVLRSRTYTASFPLRVAANSTYTATAMVRESTLSVPYVMFFESNATGAIRVSRGTWSGVSTYALECVVTPN